MEGVLHRGPVRRRDGERPLATTAWVEGLREVPQPQDVGRCDELRAHPVLVQPGDAGAWAGGTKPAPLGPDPRRPEPLQSRGTRLPERVLVVNRRPASNA